MSTGELGRNIACIRHDLAQLVDLVREQNGRVGVLETRVAVSETRLSQVERNLQTAGNLSKGQAASMAGAGGVLAMMLEFLWNKLMGGG